MFVKLKFYKQGGARGARGLKAGSVNRQAIVLGLKSSGRLFALWEGSSLSIKIFLKAVQRGVIRAHSSVSERITSCCPLNALLGRLKAGENRSGRKEVESDFSNARGRYNSACTCCGEYTSQRAWPLHKKLRIKMRNINLCIKWNYNRIG